MPGPRAALLSWIASQLAQPHGAASGVIARILNRSNRRTITAAVEAVHLTPGSVAADVGFGGGAGLRMLLDRVGATGRVYGIDLSSEMIALATRKYQPDVAGARLSLRQGSMTQLPLDDGVLDAVITVNTIYFIADIDRAFQEMARTMKRGGSLAVGIGDPQGMARLPMTPYGFRLRPVEEVIAAGRSAGLSLRDHLRSGRGVRAHHVLVFAHS